MGSLNKLILLRFMFLITLLTSASCYANKVFKFKKVDNNVVSHIDEYIKNSYQLIDQNSAIVMHFYDSSKFERFRMSIVDKGIFKWYLNEKKVTINGFFEYKSNNEIIPVLVFGEPPTGLFIKDTILFELNYLKKNTIRVTDNNNIPELLPYMEPTVFIYEIEGETYRLISTGYYELLW